MKTIEQLEKEFEQKKAELQAQLNVAKQCPVTPKFVSIYNGSAMICYEAKSLDEAKQIYEDWGDLKLKADVKRDGYTASMVPSEVGYSFYYDINQYHQEMEFFTTLGKVSISLPKNCLGFFKKDNPRARVHFKLQFVKTCEMELRMIVNYKDNPYMVEIEK